MDAVISVVPADKAQDDRQRAVDPAYAVHVANWKPAQGPGSLIGTFDASIPQFSLSLRCALKRDQRGKPFVDLPRVRVETPAGAVHLKRLARWSTAEAERRFQDAAMSALHQLLTATRGGR